MKVRTWILCITAFLVVTIAYFSRQYYWLLTTEELPYRNLTHIGTSSCYIPFKIEYKDSIYTIVMPNENASDLVREKNNLQGLFYSLYMKEVIAHDISLDVDDSLFSQISYFIVDPKIVSKYRGVNMKQDSTIFGGENFLRYDIKRMDFNAIVYVFLEQGSNSCVHCYSGATGVYGK